MLLGACAFSALLLAPLSRSSRKEVEESAAKLASQVPITARDHNGAPRAGHPFVTSADQFAALAEGSAAAQSPELARLLLHGVAFHSAGLCPADRGLVEGLFLRRHIQARSGAAVAPLRLSLPPPPLLL